MADDSREIVDTLVGALVRRGGSKSDLREALRDSRRADRLAATIQFYVSAKAPHCRKCGHIPDCIGHNDTSPHFHCHHCGNTVGAT